MRTGPIGETCPCGADDWEITATLIECRACLRLWGRVNGIWVQAEGPPEGARTG
jgi:hypothetical protein